MEQQNQIKEMATIVYSIVSLIKQKFKGEGSPTSTGLNIPDGSWAPIMGALSTSGNDQVSLQASNLFFQRADHHEPQSKLSPEDQPKDDDRAHVSTKNPDQTYWISSVDEYADKVQYVLAVSSPIAKATKLFRQKPIKPDSLKDKLEQATMPANCLFLNIKLPNSSV